MKRNTLKCITAAHTTTKGPETPSLVSIFTLQEGLGQSGIQWKYQNLNLNLGSEKSQKKWNAGDSDRSASWSGWSLQNFMIV